MPLPWQGGDGLRDAGPAPARFTVASGQGCNVLAASWAAFPRCGSGGFAAGYSPGLREDDGNYRLTTLRGRALGAPALRRWDVGMDAGVDGGAPARF